MTTQFTFITSGPVDGGRPTISDASLVRSRCMVGKNKRPDSRRSTKEACRKTIINNHDHHQYQQQQRGWQVPRDTDPDTNIDVDLGGLRQIQFKDAGADADAEYGKYGRFCDDSATSAVLALTGGELQSCFAGAYLTPMMREELYGIPDTDKNATTTANTICDPKRATRWIFALLSIGLSINFNASIDALVRPKPPQSKFLLEPIRFGGELGSLDSRELLRRFTEYAKTKQCNFAITRCVEFTSLLTDRSSWLVYNDTFFYSLLFIHAALHDFVLRRGYSQATRFNLERTLSLLSESLHKDPRAYEDDGNFLVIVNLIFMSTIMGDFDAVQSHMKGLARIVRLRGDDFLVQNPILAFKIDNMDLRWYLTSGAAPTFLVSPTNWEPIFKGIFPRARSRNEDSSISFDLRDTGLVKETRLVETYQDLQQLVLLINTGHNSGTQMQATRFQVKWHNVQARLLNLEESRLEPTSELLRLGTLAFLSTTFQITGRKLPYPYLGRRICNTLSGILERKYDDSQAIYASRMDLYLWTFVIIALSDVEVPEKFLRQGLTYYKLSDVRLSWEAARERLMRICWIPCIHDGLGKKAFKRLTRERNPA